jgi:hypothetical protein
MKVLAQRSTVLSLSLVGLVAIAWGASLTTENVQRTVDQALDWTTKGGVARVTGIQELAQQNEARADISFDGFRYNADISNTPMQKDEVTPPEPDAHSPTFYQDMANLPARQRQVVQYSGPGVGVLKHYNDGRWVLTEVHFNFVYVRCNIQITDKVPPPGFTAKTPSPAPRAKDGVLDVRSKDRIRDSFGPEPGRPHPWFTDLTVTVGPAKDNKATVLLSGKCRADLTKGDTYQAFACRAGETVKVRYEFLLAFVNDCQCWEPSKAGGISATQLGR